MRITRLALPFFLCALLAGYAAAAAVSDSRQSCIRAAMAAGAKALGSPSQLDRLYERYFAGERIAQLAAGRDWLRYDKAQKSAQRNKVKRIVVSILAPSLSRYGSSKVKFVSESGSKVRGIVMGPNGQRRTVTWYFSGPCQFSNVSIAGFGSLISFVGKGPAKD